MSKESNEIFTLALTTSNTNSNNDNNPVLRIPGNYADVTWNVDWDTLFRGRQSLFKFCRVRFSLYQGTATYNWNAQTGYLAANFSSDFNAPTTMLPTILSLLYAQQTPNTQTTDQCYIVSTLNECGVDINLSALVGRQFLNIKWVNDDAYSLIANIATDWEIILQFELSN
jgi:hypothetical protein